MMEIKTAERKDSDAIASIISESNRDVAHLFGLNINNAPKHPSFCKTSWIISDFDRGQEYFLSTENDVLTGCVAFEQRDSDTAYLNRLSVLPIFRQKGLGSALVKHIIEYAKVRNVKTISIGIIAEHTQLKQWYARLGFVAGAINTFDHLPFDVLYMEYHLNL